MTAGIFRQSLPSMIAAVAIATIGTAIAIVPAQARPASLADWKADVERRIDKALVTPRAALRNRSHATSIVRLELDASGHVVSIRPLDRSGDTAVDGAALRAVHALDLPPLPEAQAGNPRTVDVVIGFDAA